MVIGALDADALNEGLGESCLVPTRVGGNGLDFLEGSTAEVAEGYGLCSC